MTATAHLPALWGFTVIKMSFTFEKFCENLNARYNVEVIQMFHENFFDLESFLDDLYERPDPKTFNINHVFQVRIESEHVCYRQDFHVEAES